MTNKYVWLDEDQTQELIKAFIIKCCELSITPGTIGEYTALMMDGIFEARKEREIED